MNFIENFSIEKIDDLKSKLFFNGKYTRTNVYGIDLRYQIKILDKYYLDFRVGARVTKVQKTNA